MCLIQILLPVYNNTEEPFPQEMYKQVRKQLTEKFGGLTSYVRSPLLDYGKKILKKRFAMILLFMK